MKKLLIFLAGLLVLYVGLTYFISNLVLDTPNRSLEESYRIATQQWKINVDSIRATLPPPAPITFRSPVDGLALRGWYFRQDGTRCAVVMAHGYHDNRLSMLKYTPYFDRCGCDLLLYDHRGFGESDEAYGTGGINEATDLLAAHAYVRSLTGLADDRIGWFGESWGAATVLLDAGRQTVRPAFVIAESPYADWETAITERGVRDYGPALAALTPGTFRWVAYRSGTDFVSASPLLAGENIGVPTLLLHSLADTLTAPEQSDYIAERINPEMLTYHRLDWGAWHAHNVVWRPRAYERLLAEFIGRKRPEFCTP
ncbi:alpha/beta hydrolase [Lewinella sp. JB7]|uniref:alpha/beta hydrolase n=1 Tax=Lewinella sp. JB7 TaxID=2962887 RepID=UPI0020C9D9D3|nr:alpha/beta fold hydrolase [Lewinella sp. JB7]MCP9235065.1 alpha/beta hydrolase [Lewinella sp. JB7]